MTKREKLALERVWAAEVEGRLPFQSRAKIYELLKDDGLVEWWDREFKPDRFGKIIVGGWNLTHAGRLAYCMTCKDVQP